MTATPHEHLTEFETGTCTICYGEGFVKAAELADDIFTRLALSVTDLQGEMHKTRLTVEASLAELKRAGNRL